MEKGHMGIRELLVTTLLVLGLTAAVFVVTDGEGPPAGLSQQAAPAPQASVISGTIGNLFEDGMARAQSDFYATDPNGTYNIRTYMWALPSMDSAPDTLPLKKNDLRAAPVRFNDRYDDSLRGFAYRVYQRANLTGPPLVRGTAVFISEQNLLEGYLQEGGRFDMRYDHHPERSQKLEDCSVLRSYLMATSAGTPVKVYDVWCRVTYGASP